MALQGLTIEIKPGGMAEKSKDQPTPGVTSSKTVPVEGLPDGLQMKTEGCSSGHIQRVVVNGVCYVQMCCGGQWLYWHKGDVWCTCNLGQSWTVNCDGNNWIIPCR